MGAVSSTLPNNETVTLRLPSGEEVDAIVPSGMSDEQIGLLMKSKHPDFMVPDPKKSLQMESSGPTEEQEQQTHQNMNRIANSYVSALPLMLGGGMLNKAISTETLIAKPTEQAPSIPTSELQERVALPDARIEQARGLGLAERGKGRPASETGEALATIPTEMDRLSPLPDHVVVEKTAIPTHEPAKGLGLVRQKNIPPASQTGEALGAIPTPGQLAISRLQPLSDEQVARAISLPTLDDIEPLPPRVARAEGAPATTMRVAQPGLERPVTENPVVGGLVRAMQESGVPIAKRPNLLLEGSGRVNRILGPEEDLSGILAKSLRQAKRQKE